MVRVRVKGGELWLPGFVKNGAFALYLLGRLFLLSSPSTRIFIPVSIQNYSCVYRSVGNLSGVPSFEALVGGMLLNISIFEYLSTNSFGFRTTDMHIIICKCQSIKNHTSL